MGNNENNWASKKMSKLHQNYTIQHLDFEQTTRHHQKRTKQH